MNTLHNIPKEVEFPVLPESWNLGLQGILNQYPHVRFRINLGNHTMRWNNMENNPEDYWEDFPLHYEGESGEYDNIGDWQRVYNQGRVPFTAWDRVEIIG